LTGAGEEGEPDDAVQEPQEDDDEQEQPAQRTSNSSCKVGSFLFNLLAYSVSGFVQTLESPEIKILRFPGLESPRKGIGLGKPWKSPGILKCS